MAMTEFDPVAFSIDDDKLWINYRAAHSDRMWTRFNYFLTIEAALVAFFTIDSSTAFVARARWAAVAEIVISLMLVLVGARDAYLWRVINDGSQKARGASRPYPASLCRFTGVDIYRREDTPTNALVGRLLGTHRSNMTVTSMAVRLPLVAALLWSVVAGILVCDSVSVIWWLGAVLGVVFFVVVLLVMGAMTGIKADPEGPESRS